MALHHVEAVMGTTVSIDVVDSHDRSLLDRLVRWFHHVDEVFSPYKENSTVSRIGRGELGPSSAELTGDVLEVLRRCDRLVVETGGVFDVWNLPSPNGTRFDPCGYVKGWSVQRAAYLLEQQGCHHFCLNAGGDIVLAGRNHDGGPWSIGIRHPDDAQRIAMVLRAGGPLAIATSGSYERGAHIIDPRDGSPVTDLASVTVVGPSLADADAFATTLYVMGLPGLRWLQERTGYGGCVITRDDEVYTTPDFDAVLVR
ncbi:MAG: FAD:protein FMN transferase [Acidobacteria bacterium]|nr:FAD:protein FMN transferase [Acidobacteriota bacterium]